MDESGLIGPIDRERELVEKFLQLRKSLGLSQDELSQRLVRAGLHGMNQMAVSRLEKGKRALRFHEAVVIAEVMGQSLPQLMESDLMQDAEMIKYMALEAQAEDDLERLESSVRDVLRRQVELVETASRVGFAMTHFSYMMASSILPIHAVVRRGVQSYFKGESDALPHDFLSNDEHEVQNDILNRFDAMEAPDPAEDLRMLKGYLRRANGVDPEAP